MLHLVCECQPLQTQHFFIFLFASLKKWLFVIIFVTLCYSYSMKHLLSSLLLVFLAGYFGFQVSARQLSAESGAERASKRRSNCVQLYQLLGFFSYFNHSYSYSYAYVLSHKNSTCRDIDKLLCFFCRKKYYLCCVRQYYFSNTIFKIFTLKPEDGEKNQKPSI